MAPTVVAVVLCGALLHAGWNALVKKGRDPFLSSVLVASGAREAGGGHGLVGMRERATMLGGSLDAGPTADGGFRVAAVLPVRHHRPRRAGAAVTEAPSR